MSGKSGLVRFVGKLMGASDAGFVPDGASVPGPEAEAEAPEPAVPTPPVDAAKARPRGPERTSRRKRKAR